MKIISSLAAALLAAALAAPALAEGDKHALPAGSAGAAAPAASHEGHFDYERQKWSFGGFWGQYDKAQLQRGFQVYQQVCVNCHGLSRVSFRNLVQPGGPEFPELSVKDLAAKWPNRPLAEPNDDGAIADRKGNLLTRPALLSDPILGPYRNDKEAKAAQNGAVPPNLSVIAKARDLHNGGFWLNHIGLMAKDVFNGYQEGGPDYIHALLISFHDQPPAYGPDANGKLVPLPAEQAKKDSLRCASINVGEAGDDGKIRPDECVALNEGLYYNAVYPGHQIHMPPPLVADGQVPYSDGTPATVDQYARDVSAYLMWAADPSLNERKDVGLRMIIYFAILAGLLWLAKRRIWASLH